MIACGLCVMGGCYAQNADAACDDTYWPAEHVKTPDGEMLPFLSLNFSGGSSASDCIYFKGMIDFDAATAPYDAWANFMGIIASQSSSSTWYSDSCSLRIYQKYQLNITYGIEKWTVGATRGLLVLEARNSHICITRDGDMLLEGACPPFVVPAKPYRSRYVLLRNNVLREFWGGSYSNADTGVRFVLQAMQSPTGGYAVWENYNDSLVEI